MVDFAGIPVSHMTFRNDQNPSGKICQRARLKPGYDGLRWKIGLISRRCGTARNSSTPSLLTETSDGEPTRNGEYSARTNSAGQWSHLADGGIRAADRGTVAKTIRSAEARLSQNRFRLAGCGGGKPANLVFSRVRPVAALGRGVLRGIRIPPRSKTSQSALRLRRRNAHHGRYNRTANTVRHLGG